MRKRNEVRPMRRGFDADVFLHGGPLRSALATTLNKEIWILGCLGSCSNLDDIEESSHCRQYHPSQGELLFLTRQETTRCKFREKVGWWLAPVLYFPPLEPKEACLRSSSDLRSALLFPRLPQYSRPSRSIYMNQSCRSFLFKTIAFPNPPRTSQLQSIS